MANNDNYRPPASLQPPKSQAKVDQGAYPVVASLAVSPNFSTRRNPRHLLPCCRLSQPPRCQLYGQSAPCYVLPERLYLSLSVSQCNLPMTCSFPKRGFCAFLSTQRTKIFSPPHSSKMNRPFRALPRVLKISLVLFFFSPH